MDIANTSITLSVTVAICVTTVLLAVIWLFYKCITHRVKPSQWVYLFLSSIILFIGIGIFSYKFYGNINVLDFFSLASAIISIILAVITIIYSYFTNSRSVGQSERIEKAASDINESANKLGANIDQILERLSRVEQKVIEIHARQKTNANSTNTALKDGENFDLNKYVTAFINDSSPIGVMTLYACVLSMDKNKPFPLGLAVVQNQNEFAIRLYCAGYYICTVSTGIISGSMDSDALTATVTAYIPDLKDAILSYFDTRQSDKGIMAQKDEIDKYFSA